jgi:hypothetical protein
MLRNDNSPLRSHPSAEYRLMEQMILLLAELTGEDWHPHSPSEKYPFDRLLSKELSSKEGSDSPTTGG